jgi:O-antigen ligase
VSFFDRPLVYEKSAFRNPDKTLAGSRNSGRLANLRNNYGELGLQNLAAGYLNTRLAAGIAVLFGILLIATRSKWSFLVILLMIPLLIIAKLRFSFAKRLWKENHVGDR